MNDDQYLETATAGFSTRRSSRDPDTTDDLVDSTIRKYSDLYEESRKSKYISIEAAMILFEEERHRVSLYAIPVKDSRLERPRWTLKVIYDTGPQYTLHSRSRHSSPIYANAPNGVYGIAAEVGAELVVLCMPTE
jgi:hypothetical protein